MSPIPTPSSSVHDTTTTTAIEPERTRRPPNAWILFRTERSKLMSSPLPGEPALPQAEKSKILAKMWRDAPASTKAHYEHLSEVYKEEHKLKHPDYRFKPMKRAEKERLRAEKLAEKELARATRKARPRTRARARSVVPQNTPPLFTTEPRHGISTPSAPVYNAPNSSSDNVLSGIDTLVATPYSDRSTPSTSHLSLPPPPSTSSIPPLVVPQPGVPLSMPEWQQFAQTPVDEFTYPDLTFAALLPELSGCLAASQHSTQQLVPNQVHSSQPTQQMDYDPSLALVDPTHNPLVYICGTGEFLDDQQVFDESLGMKVDCGSLMTSDANAYGTIDLFDSIEGTSNLENISYNRKTWEEMLAFLDGANGQQHASENAVRLDQSNINVAPLQESSNVNVYLADDPS